MAKSTCQKHGQSVLDLRVCPAFKCRPVYSVAKWNIQESVASHEMDCIDQQTGDAAMSRKWPGTTVMGASIIALVLSGCGGSDDAPVTASEKATATTAVQACEQLAGKTLGGASVVGASVVPASGATPLYCKVTAHIEPALNVELRLPNIWNGKLYYTGGGGYNGVISPLNLNALQKGYAAVATDGGHQGGDVWSASFALNDPLAAQMQGYLSIPTAASAATEMIRAAYGIVPSRSYFEGSSNGGREGLIGAQRYPNLFDGIIARAPAYNWVGFIGHFNRNVKAVAALGGQFSAGKLTTLAAAVRRACDADDGIADGIVSNPSACTFNPQTLRCPEGADTGDACLSDAQMAVITSVTTPISLAGSPTYHNVAYGLTGNEDDPAAGQLGSRVPATCRRQASLGFKTPR
jgi:hypothetical protein